MRSCIKTLAYYRFTIVAKILPEDGGLFTCMQGASVCQRRLDQKSAAFSNTLDQMQ